MAIQNAAVTRNKHLRSIANSIGWEPANCRSQIPVEVVSLLIWCFLTRPQAFRGRHQRQASVRTAHSGQKYVSPGTVSQTRLLCRAAESQLSTAFFIAHRSFYLS